MVGLKQRSVFVFTTKQNICELKIEAIYVISLYIDHRVSKIELGVTRKI